MASKKSICYVIGTTDIGGAEMHLLRVCRGLRSKGWDITVYSLANPGLLAGEFEKTGAQVIHPPRIDVSGVLRKPTRLLQIFLIGIRLFFGLLFTRPKIIHFFLPAAYLVGGPIAVLTGCANRLMSRRSRNHYQSKHPKLSALEHWLHKHMHGVLGNSKAVVQDLLDENVPDDRLGLLYNGIEISDYGQVDERNATRKLLDLQDNSLVMTLVANLIPYKGHMDLLNALSQVKDRFPRRLVCSAGRL